MYGTNTNSTSRPVLKVLRVSAGKEATIINQGSRAFGHWDANNERLSKAVLRLSVLGMLTDDSEGTAKPHSRGISVKGESPRVGPATEIGF